MVHYKLTYFNLRGMGEISRCILHYANVPFEDNRITNEEWIKLKSSKVDGDMTLHPLDTSSISVISPVGLFDNGFLDTPFGHLPLLEVDGKILTGSLDIARYLARQYDLAGADDFESAYLDSIADFLKDISLEVRPYFVALQGSDQEENSRLYQGLYKSCFEKNTRIIEKLLQESGSGFIAKSGLTWVDFYLLNFCDTTDRIAPELSKQSRVLEEFKKRMHALPQLQEYFKNRPDTLL